MPCINRNSTSSEGAPPDPQVPSKMLSAAMKTSSKYREPGVREG